MVLTCVDMKLHGSTMSIHVWIRIDLKLLKISSANSRVTQPDNSDDAGVGSNLRIRGPISKENLTVAFPQLALRFLILDNSLIKIYTQK